MHLAYCYFRGSKDSILVGELFLSKDRLVFTDWLLFKIDDLNIIRSKMFIVISSAKKLQIAKALNCFEGKDDTIQRIKRYRLKHYFVNPPF